jgi:ribosomal protein S18 acetylase RimI-like enzyme
MFHLFILLTANSKNNFEKYYRVGSLDYCHIQEWHLPQVNSLLSKAFWPCIDMKEYLKQPEHTIIALYKRLVVGCGFITPQGYISYLFTHPDWRRSGIGKFMLYQLIQSCNISDAMQDDDDEFQPMHEPNDITLHISVHNTPGITLCEKFGFRQEETVTNFYAHFFTQKCSNDLQNVKTFDSYYYRLKQS